MPQPTLTLVRYAETTAEDGTLEETIGELRLETRDEDDQRTLWSCKALELPDRDNKRNVSRIPSGRYVAEVVASSPAFDYPHVWIHDEGSVFVVGERAGIKIHVATYARQLRGCVAVGARFVDIDPEGNPGHGQLDLVSSAQTLGALVEHLRATANERDAGVGLVTGTVGTELRVVSREPTSLEAAPLKELDARVGTPTRL
jgi:hypothetical protein